VLTGNGTERLVSADIITAKMYVHQLQERFSGLEVPAYKLKRLYSTTHHVFFDCEEQDPVACLDAVLKHRHFHSFTVFLVVKGPTGALKVMGIHFNNIGEETLEHFIKRFHTALEPSTKLSLQLAGSEYVTCIGHSYSEG